MKLNICSCSFVVYSEDHKRYTGVTLNFDAHDEPEVNIDNNLNIIFEFLEFLEGPIRYVLVMWLKIAICWYRLRGMILIINFVFPIFQSFRDKKLPKGKRQILHNFMMGTDTSLSATENIELVTFMENEVIKISKRKGFVGVLTTNTNPLTQVWIINVANPVFHFQLALRFFFFYCSNLAETYSNIKHY